MDADNNQAVELQEKVELAKLLVGEWAEEMLEPALGWLDVYLRRPEDLVPAAAGLRVKRLGYLAAVTGLDFPDDARFEVVYHFCTQRLVVNLRIKTSYQQSQVPTLGEIIPSAIPFERELQEMFGIEVSQLGEADQLYLPDDWPENTYPLRKDFNPKLMFQDVQEEL